MESGLAPSSVAHVVSMLILIPLNGPSAASFGRSSPRAMSEPPSREDEFQALRLAAERLDRNGCWEATQKLLRRLPEHRALLLVRDFVTRRLPVFERHQPGVHWP